MHYACYVTVTVTASVVELWGQMWAKHGTKGSVK